MVGGIMGTVVLSATKMTDAKATFISLVERGANRIPFKIVKRVNEETAMGIDLRNLGRVLKGESAVTKEQPKAELLAVVVEKTEDMTELETALTAAGFSIAMKTEQSDGAVVYKQTEFAEEGTQILKMEGGLLVMKGMDMYSASMESTSFKDIIATQGYYPSVRMAVDALATGLQNIPKESEGNATDLVATTVDEFKSYILGLIKLLPETVTKAETAIADASLAVQALKAAKDKKKDPAMDKDGDGDGKTEGTETPMEEMTEEQKAKAKKDAAKVPAKKADGTEGVGVVAGTETVQKQVQDAVAAATAAQSEMLQSMVASIQKSVEDVAGTVASVQKSVEGMGARLDEVGKVAEAASNSVKGVVLAAPPADNEDTVVQKSAGDTDPRQGQFDTAYIQKRVR
jgi:hypothetical protein